jgi:hypothetical protein
MDIGTIKNIWLKPGVSSKKKNIKEGRLTPKYSRMPIVEKGVGRLGSHKLGSQIEQKGAIKLVKSSDNLFMSLSTQSSFNCLIIIFVPALP